MPALTRALEDLEPLVRGHAAWAPARIGTAEAREALEMGVAVEADGSVIEEMALALRSW